MNAALWPAMREYIQAEIRLAVARCAEAMAKGSHASPDTRTAMDAYICDLEEQVSRMETAVREGLESAIGKKP